MKYGKYLIFIFILTVITGICFLSGCGPVAPSTAVQNALDDLILQAGQVNKTMQAVYTEWQNEYWLKHRKQIIQQAIAPVVKAQTLKTERVHTYGP